MTTDEIFWLEMCKTNPTNYRICVDNDEVFVVDYGKDCEVFTFNNFGWRMVIDLLRYIGCNAEEV